MRRLVETASLFVLIVVVALRPLIAESYDSAGSSLTSALGAVSDPRPLHTLLIDLTILLACLGWAVAHGLSPRSYRRTGMEWGLALIAVAALASCFVAGNKRLAINATIDWLSMAALGIVLAQLVDTAWRRWLVLSAIIASGAAQSAQCIDQAFGFDDDWNHYLSIREDFWHKQGVALDSSKVEQFERRMQAREAPGFLQHSNVAGSHLILVGLPVLGVCLEFLRRRLAVQAALSLVVLGAIIAALILTKSRGAMVALGAGLVLYGMIRVAASWPKARRWRAACVLWVMIALGIAAIVGYGWRKGTLPDASLAFRWEYWTSSLALFRHDPLTGVGRENFGRHYTQFKSIESPEEIANPHNLLVQAGCEWGIIGAVGLVIMIVGWSLRGATSEPESSAARQDKPAGNWIAWGLGLGLVMTLIRVPLLGSNDAAFLYYSSMMAGLAWAFGFAAVASGVSAGQVSQFPRAAVIAGAAAFLIHDLISFALWVPGTATTFFAIAALTVSRTEPKSMDRPARWGRWLHAVGMILAIILVVILGVIPVARAERRMMAATGAGLVRGPLTTQPVLGFLQAASGADPFDPTPQAARAEWFMAYSQAVPEHRDAAQRGAIEALSEAIRRDPLNIGLWRRRTLVRGTLAEGSGSRADYDAAVDDARQTLSLYPANPADWVLLADTLAKAGEALASREMLQEAALHYVYALHLDERRPSWETIRRMRAAEKAAIEEKLQKTRGLLGRL